MVKVRTICRNPKEYEKKSAKDMMKLQRNPDPQLHPFQEAREYQRALNAAKIEKIFSKPFVSALDVHSDSIISMAKNYNSMVEFVTGGVNGEIVMWDLHKKTHEYVINGHTEGVKGLTYVNPKRLNLTDKLFLSSGDDKYINIWSMSNLQKQRDDKKIGKKVAYEPKMQYLSKTFLYNIDHNFEEPKFATSGAVVQIWDYEKSEPVIKYDWGSDSVIKVKWNPSETNLICSTASDRSI